MSSSSAETFEGNALDESRWIPHYLSQWSSRERRDQPDISI